MDSVKREEVEEGNLESEVSEFRSTEHPAVLLTGHRTEQRSRQVQTSRLNLGIDQAPAVIGRRNDFKLRIRFKDLESRADIVRQH